MFLKISGERSLELIGLDLCVDVVRQRGIWRRYVYLPDEMQLCFSIADESSNVSSEFSAVQRNRGVEVVVLLKDRNAYGFNIATRISQ